MQVPAIIPKRPFAAALTLALALGAVPGVASAAEPAIEAADAAGAARIAELNEAGARAYAERNYRAAIEKFVEAYAIDHDPNLLFNIARCYEKLGDLGAAIEKYEAFIAAPGADTDGRLKAKTSLLELQKLRDQGGVGTNPGTTSEQEAPPAGDATADDGSSSTRLWPWVTLGAGVVVTAVGATFYGLGIQDHNQVTTIPGYGDPSVVTPITRAEAQSYVDSGTTKKIVGGIGLGLGGALLATSAVLFITGKSAAPSESGSLTLAPSAHGLSAAYSGRF